MDDNKIILLIEDDNNDITLIKNAFDKSNFQGSIEIFRDGEKALAYLLDKNFCNNEDRLPKFILLDIKIPKLNGLQILKELRSHDEYKYIPIIILTSSRQQNDLIESYLNGANAYIVKPVGFNEFNNMIENIKNFWYDSNVIPDYNG